MDLLEREPILAALDGLLRDAAGGAGRIAAVSGEAGAGKTSVVEHFVAAHRRTARSLRGLCDPLSTPRPLGPVHDMAEQSRGPLATALREGAGREQLFSAFLAELAREPTPCIAVVEDAHWADDATLDVLRFAGRRIGRVPALLVVTYRDDELHPDHQLHKLLGELPRDVVHWLRLPLLSEGAVRELARQHGRDAEGVYALTGGNPFFVTEVLASGNGAVPASIREALLARAAHLSAPARELLDLVSVAPGRMERRLLEALLDDAPALIRECAARGVLAAAADSVGFRHELARRAWEGALEPGAPAPLHARILRALLDREAGARDLARLVHHADGARDGERVLDLAPAAAREAAAVGAHRQAAAHYATALRYADGLPPESRAALLEWYAYERHLAAGLADATRARHEALALRRALGDRRGEGVNLRWLSRLAWFDGDRADALAFGEEAIAVLEPLGDTPELAMAYSNLAQLHMLASSAAGATRWGERAIALAERLGDIETMVHALTNVGAAEVAGPRVAEGRQRLDQSIDMALRHGFHEHAARAYVALSCTDVRHFSYAGAEEKIEQTLRFAVEHELEVFELYILGWRARVALERGNWEAAERDASSVAARHLHLGVLRCLPLVVLALLRARRDGVGADALLDEAVAFALSTGEVQRIGPAVCARAEAAWIRGEPEAARRELEDAWEIVQTCDDIWDRTELALWARRAGSDIALPDDPPELFRLQIRGDWAGAAAAWQRIGAPYRRALALAGTDEPDAWQEALATLEALGAHAAAAAVRRDLRRRGARGIPRGPRRATRRHPAGLTAGQERVLALLARGLSNADIARELSLSPRTVDHHVSAILGKLDVTTRAAAIAAAHARRLLPRA
jgi:DNA-binding CsgD family transcriptional regulator